MRRLSAFARAGAMNSLCGAPGPAAGVEGSGVGTTAGSNAAASAMRCHSTKKDYYEVLGVSRTANETEIKKAYRKLALKLHPDQGGDKDKFAEVNEAYDCLSRPEKRQVYDAHGHDAVNNMGMGGSGMGGMHRSAEDIFADFFGRGGSSFGDMFGGGGGRQVQQVRDADVNLSLTLEEIYKGCTKTVRVQRPTVCGTCRGTGSKSGQKPKCTQCNGTGQEVTQHRMGQGMIQQVVSACKRCRGTGKVSKPEDVCHPCQGEGYVTSKDDVHLDIPASVPDGATLCLRGEGGTMPDTVPGNLNVHISVVPHKIYTRRGSDLLVYHDISLAEALLGFEMKLKLLDGRTITVRSKEDEPIQHNGVIQITGEGMKPMTRDIQGATAIGNIYIVTRINMPKNLTKEQKDALHKAFGHPVITKDAPSAPMIQRKETLQQLEARKAQEWGSGGQVHEEGHEEQRTRSRSGGRRGGGAQNVECAQQ